MNTQPSIWTRILQSAASFGTGVVAGMVTMAAVDAVTGSELGDPPGEVNIGGRKVEYGPVRRAA
jgi:acyl dehydratase